MVGVGEVTAGGDVTSIEVYTVGAVTAVTSGNLTYEGIPTPGEAAVSFESRAAAATFINPMGIAFSNGYYATLDSPTAGGVTGTDTLRGGDGNISTGAPFQEPMEYKSTSYGGSSFNKPQGLVGDSQGRFYVADTGHQRVVEFGQLPFIGSYYNVVTNLPWLGFWTGGNGYSFKKPVAVAVDLSDNVYVADVGTGNTVVQKYSPEGVRVLGTWTLINNCQANGLAVDGNSNFYVSDIGTGPGGGGQVEEYHMNSSTSATLLRAWTVPAVSLYENVPFYPGPIALIGNSSLTTITNILVGDQNNDVIQEFGP